MLWLDYTIEQGNNKFRVRGDTDSEVVNKGLYKPGEVYIVGADGWLHKVDDVTALIYKYENSQSKKT